MNRGEVYWVRFPDAPTGTVIRKVRPAVILTADSAIPHLNRVQVVPLTSNLARLYPGEAFVVARGRRSKALATQISTVDKSDVLGYFDALTATDLVGVEGAVRAQLGL